MDKIISGHGLMTTAGSQALDKWAVDKGLILFEFMERAGAAVADAVAGYAGHPDIFEGEICILTGPGNNGGDGYVAARHLHERGYKTVIMLAEEGAIATTEARKAANLWLGETAIYDPARLSNASMIVDALFGVGLSRPVEGIYADMINCAKKSEAFRLAVDIPSGLDADTGLPVGEHCFSADATVTFTRYKSAHLIAPGRFLSGGVEHIHVSDIGFPADAVGTHTAAIFENSMELWGHMFPYAGPLSHKYDRGHLLVLGGREPALGASRLASLAGLRIGAGLVTLGGTN